METEPGNSSSKARKIEPVRKITSLVPIFSCPRTNQDVACRFNWNHDACRHHDTPVSVERGGHCNGWSLHPPHPGPYYPGRCILYLGPRLEHVSFFSGDDGSFRTSRGGGPV